MAKQKLTSSELTVLESLIYPESFAKIMDETGQQSGELRDNLINLLNYGLIEAFDDNKQVRSTEFYDVDNLPDFTFRATSKGLALI
jgi:predicted transcriptional regulator